MNARSSEGRWREPLGPRRLLSAGVDPNLRSNAGGRQGTGGPERGAADAHSKSRTLRAFARASAAS